MEVLISLITLIVGSPNCRNLIHMKKLSVIFITFLICGCSTISKNNSTILSAFKRDARSHELVYTDLIWDGGTTIIEISYTGNFEGERSIFIWNKYYPESPNRRVFVSESDSWDTSTKEEITSESDKNYLKAVLEVIEKDYPQVLSTISVLRGDIPMQTAKSWKVSPKMKKKVEDFLNEVKLQKEKSLQNN